MRPTSRPSFIAVALLALVSAAIGVLAALAEGAHGARTVAARPVPVALTCAAPAAQPPKPEPVPQDLLDAFGVLRRAATADDVLPDGALGSLRQRGLEPFDPAAARLLRTTGDGGRAWIVPVRDATPRWRGLVLACPGGAVLPVPVPRRGRLPRALRVNPKFVPARPPAAVPAVPVAPRRPAKPQPGVAVVALGGAPAGGGGTLADLVRGRAPVTSYPCGGPDHDMLTVSGVVPDGVAAAFLTSPDGTAVRADVKDNAYAFVVPRPKDFLQRYVVWTGGDGTPHVSPVNAVLVPFRARCPKSVGALQQITPGIEPACGAVVLPARLPRRPLPAPLPAPAPAPVDRVPGLIAGPCLAPPPAVVLSRPRPPRRHR